MIKPGTGTPTISLKGQGNIPVAILSTDTFDATQVNSATVTFGEHGTEATAVHAALQDVNGDGKLDMIVQFPTQQSGFQCGDTVGLMTMTTFSNQQYMAVGAMQTNCNN